MNFTRSFSAQILVMHIEHRKFFVDVCIDLIFVHLIHPLSAVFYHNAGERTRSGSKLRGEVRSVKDFVVFYFTGAVVGLILWRMVRMILTN